MNWLSQYNPPSLFSWQGRTDTENKSYFYQTIQLLDLHEDISHETTPTFAIIGFKCDEGIRRNSGRLGAAEGPSAIREALAKLPSLSVKVKCYDAGDIVCIDNHLEEAQAALGEAVYQLMHHNIIPIVIGGGHELAWGHFQGISKQYPNEELGIVNFDAHFDMRPMLPDNKGSSGTPFLQIAKAQDASHKRFNYHCIGIQHAGNIAQLFTTAADYHTHIVYAEDIHQGDNQKLSQVVQHAITDNQIIYLSLCLDVFAAAYAPGVSAAQALGLTPWQIIPAVRKLAQSGKVVGYDIAELSPKYDIDKRTAKLAANLIYDIIHHHNLI